MKNKAEIEIVLKRLRGHIPDNQFGNVVQNIEPYKDELIPKLVKALGDGYYTFGENAASVLAFMGDCEFVIPVLEHLEERGKRAIKLRIDFITNAAKSASDKERKCIIDSFITHLTKKRNKKTMYYESVTLSILDALNELEAFGNLRLKLFLKQELDTGSFEENIFQKELMTFANVDLESACLKLKQIKESFGTENKPLMFRDFEVVTRGTDETKESIGQDFAILVKIATIIRPYAFRYKNGRVYFYSQGEEKNKWFAGKASSETGAFQIAAEYLGIFFDRIKIIGKEEEITEKFHPFLERLEKYFDFKKWGFEISYISPTDEPIVIFDSKWCRVMFQLGKEVEMHRTTETFAIQYGRLHAPNTGHFLNCNGEKHWCWHRLRDILHFLDGMQPNDLANKRTSPLGEMRYQGSPDAKKAKTKSFVERKALEENENWNYYGEKLFKLFDLNNPEQWEKCILFLKEYYSLRKIYSYNKELGLPEAYEIC